MGSILHSSARPELPEHRLRMRAVKRDRLPKPPFARLLAFLLPALMAGFMLCTPLAAHAESGTFILRIQQLEVDQAQPFYLTCLEAKKVCRGRIALTLDGAEWPVFVKAVYDLGRVIIAFADESNTFAVGSENFAVIALTGRDVTKTTVNLGEPLAQLAEDSPWLGYHRPVFRQSDRIIAKVQVDVWTAH